MELISLILLIAALPVVLWHMIEWLRETTKIPIWITATATMCIVISVAIHMTITENHTWDCILWDIWMVLTWGYITLDTYSTRMKEKDIARIKQKWQYMYELPIDEYEEQDKIKEWGLTQEALQQAIKDLKQEEIKQLW